MFCGNCGHKLADGERFCPACGTTVPALDAVPPAAPVEPTPPVVPVPEIAPAFENKGSSKTGKIIIAVIAAIALLIGGIYIGSELLDDDDYYPADSGGTHGDDAPTDDSGASNGSEYSPAPGMKLVKLPAYAECVGESGNVGFQIYYTYDANHNLIKTEKINAEDVLVECHEYAYGTEGYMIGETVYGDTYGDTVQIFNYDKDGNLLVYEEMYPDEFGTMYTDRTEYFYSDGNLTEKYCYSEDYLWETTVYTYDGTGRVAYEDRYEEGSLSSHAEYYYDNFGNLVMIGYFDSNGEQYHVQSYSYDSSGNMLTDRSESISNGWFVLYEYTYDEDGNVVSWIEHNDSYSTLMIKWTYDENGNVLTEKRYDGDTVSGGWTEWFYDEDGNLIEEYWNSDGHGLDNHTYYNYNTVEVPEDRSLNIPAELKQNSSRIQLPHAS